jgi:hypothetical protein
MSVGLGINLRSADKRSCTILTFYRRLMCTDHAPVFSARVKLVQSYDFDFIAMIGNCLFVLVFFTCNAWAQSGVDLDKPMLGGGGKRGPGAMLRFGCSQVSDMIVLRNED